MYIIKTPFWLKLLYPSLLWNKNRKDKVVYLTFDDGPTPEITDKVLDILSEYDAKASFFLIGNNVEFNRDITQRIINEGHAIGNHTFNHMNGWKNDTKSYLQEIENCAELVESKLFRPPYGRIKFGQIKPIQKMGYSIVMWDVLSADFNTKLSAEQCYQNTIKNATNGSIIVFHDSVKAWPRLEETLSRALQYFSDKGYQMKALPQP